MEFYRLNVGITIPVNVRAHDREQAVALAEKITTRYPKALLVGTAFAEISPGDRLDVAAGLIKSESYTCAHCAHTALRDKWGPGWVTCPHCGEHPPTPTMVP